MTRSADDLARRFRDGDWPPGGPLAGGDETLQTAAECSKRLDTGSNRPAMPGYALDLDGFFVVEGSQAVLEPWVKLDAELHPAAEERPGRLACTPPILPDL